MGRSVLSFKIRNNISLLDGKYRRRIHVGVERIEAEDKEGKTFTSWLTVESKEELRSILRQHQ